jgi:hypothetical protein
MTKWALARTSGQNPASYRLKRRAGNALFGYAKGSKSIKDFLDVSDIRAAPGSM